VTGNSSSRVRAIIFHIPLREVRLPRSPTWHHGFAFCWSYYSAHYTS
jgi:hypothetical protein